MRTRERRSRAGVFTRYVTSLTTKSKSFSMSDSIVLDAATRVPSAPASRANNQSRLMKRRLIEKMVPNVLTATRSTPLSSARICSTRSPTLCVMGRSVNTLIKSKQVKKRRDSPSSLFYHRSLLDGSGTVRWGSPRLYSTVTPGSGASPASKKKSNSIQFNSNILVPLFSIYHC